MLVKWKKEFYIPKTNTCVYEFLLNEVGWLLAQSRIVFASGVSAIHTIWLKCYDNSILQVNLIFIYVCFRYFLQPRDVHRHSELSLGSLRAKISYTADHVFTSRYYDDLRNLLLSSPVVEVRYMTYILLANCTISLNR